jgi:hypothetical protein
MSDTNKRRFGPWSKDEKEYIAENANSLTVNEIADHISRDPESVSKYIRKTLGLRIITKNRTNTLSSGTDIENSLVWQELEKELTNDELKVFLYHWNRIVLQFKEDVFPTEEMQIIDTIKLEILMGRSLKNQRDTMERMMALQADIQKARDELGGGFDIKIENMERMLAGLKSAYALADKEFNDLLTRKSSLLKELKGTRDQRLKRIEDSKTTFVGWISELLNNPSLRKDIGIYIEKMRLATLAEKNRLSESIRYSDNIEDIPLLTPELVDKLYQEEETSGK